MDFVGFLSMIIYEVLYTRCLRYNIWYAWFLDIRISICYCLKTKLMNFTYAYYVESSKWQCTHSYSMGHITTYLCYVYICQHNYTHNNNLHIAIWLVHAINILCICYRRVIWRWTCDLLAQPSYECSSEDLQW